MQEKEPGGALAEGTHERLPYCFGARGTLLLFDPRVWRTQARVEECRSAPSPPRGGILQASKFARLLRVTSSGSSSLSTPGELEGVGDARRRGDEGGARQPCVSLQDGTSRRNYRHTGHPIVNGPV